MKDLTLVVHKTTAPQATIPLILTRIQKTILRMLNLICHHKMNGRNLVVCIDGTSNQFGKVVSDFENWSYYIPQRCSLKEYKRDCIV